MKAYRISTNEPIAPFGDSASDIPILNQPLSQVQVQTLEAAGFQLVDEPPVNEPYLLLSDRIWFTAELLRRMKSHKCCLLRITLGLRHAQFQSNTMIVRTCNDRGWGASQFRRPKASFV